MCAASVEALRALICGETKGEKMKFASKLLNTLNFTIQDKSRINTTGMCWCQDGSHFIINTNILSNFLNLKRNSINTNLRSHGFVHETCQPSEILKEFPFITDFRNWKKCHHSCMQFCTKSTQSDADRIPCQQADVIIQKPLPPLDQVSKKTTLPDSIIQIVAKGSPAYHEVKEIFRKMPTPPMSSVQVFDRIAKEWQAIAGLAPSASLDSVVSSFIYAQDAVKMPRVRANIEFLLQDSTEMTADFDSPTRFIQFLIFSLRFGLKATAAQTIEALSSFEDLSAEPLFAFWFCPSLRNSMSKDYLKKLPPGSWLVRPSSKLCCFSIQTTEVATRIQFDPLDAGLTIQTACGERRARSWGEMLFEVLRLSASPPPPSCSGEASNLPRCDEILSDMDFFGSQLMF